MSTVSETISELCSNIERLTLLQKDAFRQMKARNANIMLDAQRTKQALMEKVERTKQIIVETGGYAIDVRLQIVTDKLERDKQAVMKDAKKAKRKTIKACKRLVNAYSRVNQNWLTCIAELQRRDCIDRLQYSDCIEAAPV